MRIARAFICAAVLCWVHAALGDGVSRSDHLAPEDFGAHKWILRGNASTNEVVIFRETRTTTQGDRVVDKRVCDTVECPPASVGGTFEETVLYYDANFFKKDTTEERWCYKAFGGVGGVAGKLQSWNSSGKIVFKDAYGPGTLQTIVYEVIVMSYSRAKEIHPELPAMEPDRGWTWGGKLEE